jgi:hypothetical protein
MAQAGMASLLWQRAQAWARARPYTLLAVLFFGASAIPFQVRHDSEWDEVYVRAARHLLAGQHLYIPPAESAGYVYPPFSALLAIPFTWLPHGAARAIWYALNVLCIIGLIGWAWRLSGGQKLEEGGVGWREHLVMVLGLVCASRYIMDCLAHQQVDLVVGALLLGGCLLLSRSRSWSAATAFGLAAAIKCTALLWFPYLILRGRWRAAVWLVVVAVGVNLLPDLVKRPQWGGCWLGEWSSLLAPMRSADSVPGTWTSAIIYNQSLAGLANRWCCTDYVWTEDDCDVANRPDPASPRTVKLLLYGAELGLVLLVLLVAGIRRPEQTAPGADGMPDRTVIEYSIVLLMMLLLSPMSSKPHFCTMFLPAFCLARLAIFRAQRWCWFTLIVAIVAGTITQKGLLGERWSSLFLWWGGVTWSALFLLGGCLWALWRTRAAGAAANPFKQQKPLARAA